MYDTQNLSSVTNARPRRLRRVAGALAFSLVGLFAATDASACSCASPSRWVYSLPHHGDDAVPRNARYVVILRMGFIPEPFALYENGALVPSHVERTDVGEYGRYEVVPEALFAPNSQIRVESGDAVVEFSVGDQIDDSPPTFDSIDVASNRGPVDNCERINAHQVFVNGWEENTHPNARGRSSSPSTLRTAASCSGCSVRKTWG